MKDSRRVLKAAITAAVVAGLAGCATPSMKDMRNQQQKMYEKAVTSQKREPVHILNEAYTGGTTARYINPADQVKMSATDAPIGAMVNAVAMQQGYSVFFAQGALPTKPITLSVDDQTRLSAIRTMAEAAGYCAIVQPDAKRIIIAKHGTYVFRVPTSILQNGKANYKVGGNTAAGQSGQSGGAGGGMGGGMSGGGMGGSSGGSSSLSASFKVAGKTKSQKSADLRKQIETVAGRGSQATVNAQTGLITVSANATGLARADSFIKQYVRQADERVAVHVALLEVTLNNGLQYGINWSKIIQISGQQALGLGFVNPIPGIAAGATNPVSLSATTGANGMSSITGGLGATPQSYLNYSGQTISGIISALRTVTNTRIISQPTLVALNNTPATIFSGHQVPYVGDVQSNVASLGGTTSTGAAFSFAVNGLSLSIIPNILDDHLVSMKIVPAISNITGFTSATVDGTQISAPNQQLKQMYLQSLVPNGKTLIIGGASTTSAENQNSQTPGLGRIPGLGYLFKGINDNGTTSQLVILVHATIIPAPRYNPLVAETL